MTRMLGAVLLGAAATSAAGQGPAASFEAATVKINQEGGFAAGLDRSAGGRFVVTNLPLSTIIGFAYQLDRFELQGGPDWIRTERWDIVARMAGDFPPTPPGAVDPAALAMRGLLAERFQLSVRRDTRDIDVYFLVKARSEKTPGLRPSTTDCGALQQARDAAQERLGLRLESGRMGMPVMVVDHIERPTGD